MSFKDKEKYIEYQKQYYLDNKEKIRGLHKQYRLDNKEKIRGIEKQRYKDNKEEIQEYKKQYYLDNREKIISKTTQYRLDNKAWHRDYKRNYEKNRKNYDPLYKLKSLTRTRLYHAFKAKSWKKSSGAEKLLGCDWKTAMNHLEKQFEPWMTWENHGEWHIDHIIPLSSANTKEEMIPLFNYKNLQPLLAEDNIRKGDKIIVK